MAMAKNPSKIIKRQLIEKQALVWDLYDKKPPESHKWLLKAFYYGIDCREFVDMEGRCSYKYSFTSGDKQTFFCNLPNFEDVQQHKDSLQKLKQWLDRQVAHIITFLDNFNTYEEGAKDKSLDEFTESIAAILGAGISRSNKRSTVTQQPDDSEEAYQPDPLVPEVSAKGCEDSHQDQQDKSCSDDDPESEVRKLQNDTRGESANLVRAKGMHFQSFGTRRPDQGAARGTRKGRAS